LISDTKPISISGARVNNLKNISLELPRNKLIVFSGVSGSGKSSLAFDTLFAEGQRRFVESLSVYARQFLERMQKPDVDLLTGISPAVAIEQKTITRNPRSTVATQTEIYDYLRVLFARIGQTFCPHCGGIVRKDTPSSIIAELQDRLNNGDKFYVTFPMHRHEKHSLEDEWSNLRAQGFFRIVLAGSDRILELSDEPPQKIAPEAVRVVIDRLIWRSNDDAFTSCLADSLETAFREGNGNIVIAILHNDTTTHELNFSDRFECAKDKIPFEEPDPRLFSFNSPYGACPDCEGFGRAIGIDMDLVVPDKQKTLLQGAISCWNGQKFSSYLDDLKRIAAEAGVRMDVPYFQLTDEERTTIWEGWGRAFDGLKGFFRELETHTYKMHYRVILSRYRGYTSCPKCHGSRLRPAALNVKIKNKTIYDIVKLTITEARRFFDTLALSEYEVTIAHRLIEEIQKRLRYLDDVGLGYLTLDRLSQTLSGGESQRIQLASSLGGALTGTLYVLDEPSIGLHQRDTERLVNILHRVRDLGNTVIVVEHDEDVIRSSDHLVDFGPAAGRLGGEIIFSSATKDIYRSTKNRSLTGQYLRKDKTIPVPPKRRRVSPMDVLWVHGAAEHNLKNIDVRFPLGMLVAVTGVSGSGKSTLVHDVLYSNLRKELGEPVSHPGTVRSIQGADRIRSVMMIDQSPIGRSPRSNPATYVNAFDYIREAFAKTPYAKQRNWQAGYFSFNIPGGRCENCAGEGFVKVEMQFLADMYLTCDVCNGSRYKTETLEAELEGKNIVEILSMTVDEAIPFFAKYPRISSRLQRLADVGLGYITLGQPATTLSGGEAQRIKLASHLSENTGDGTLFIFDEPTTGLHFHDITYLLQAFNALIESGNSIIVIEHNLDVIKCADWVIDLGPDAGDRGGEVIAEGTPEMLVKNKESVTGKYLKEKLA
jgi:excinuclease ABC subunit A